ncbi:hypothetical protein MCEL_34990 [Mycolicibacterium celeriflavum]|uniref:Glyoxalase n=1 Tax=Mycolicibacterium celeriflavum TaxID=1249101 RepID=A0A7I7RKW7_MYCCF|nr:hypothetical protein MCEL_34990 [Mycolicibacterium celeriflavum]
MGKSMGTEPQPATNGATVASALIRVAELERSVNFYRDVFSCSVAIHEENTALLLTPDGFQIYLHSTGQPRRPPLASLGVQYLMWATDSEAEFERLAGRLRVHDQDTYQYTENEMSFVEGCDPDGGRVFVAHPSPSRRPRQLIASRLRGVVRPRSERTLQRLRIPRRRRIVETAPSSVGS